MNNIKISLINGDQAVQAKTDLNNAQNKSFPPFIERLKVQLVTGETALLEIENMEKSSLRFEITQAL